MRIGLMGYPDPDGDSENLGLIENRFVNGINKLETICTAGSLQTLGNRDATGDALTRVGDSAMMIKRGGMYSLDDRNIKNAYGINGVYGFEKALLNFRLGYRGTRNNNYLTADNWTDATVGGNGRYFLEVGGVFSGSTANEKKYFDSAENLDHDKGIIGQDSTTFVVNGKESGTSVDDHLYWYDTSSVKYYPQFSSAAYSPDGTRLLLMGTIHEINGSTSYWHDTTAFTYDLSPAYSISNLGGQSAGSGSPVKPYFSKWSSTRTQGSSGPHDSAQAGHCCWGSNGNKFYFTRFRSSVSIGDLVSPCNTNRPTGFTYNVSIFDWRDTHPSFSGPPYSSTDERDYFFTNTGTVENVTSMTFYPRNSGWDNVEVGDIIRVQRTHIYANSFFTTTATMDYMITSAPTHTGTNCYMTRSNSPTSYTSFGVSYISGSKTSSSSNVPVPDFDISYAGTNVPVGGNTVNRSSSYKFGRLSTERIVENNCSNYRTNSVTWNVNSFVNDYGGTRTYFWSDDGYKLFIVNDNNNIVIYDATTPWSLAPGNLSVVPTVINAFPQIDEIYAFKNDSFIDVEGDYRFTEQRLRNF